MMSAQSSMTSEYGVRSFRWTEREYKLKQLVEEHGQYLPFIMLVTEGYCSSRAEITADEIYWIHEIVTQPCIVVKDENGRYFSIPECYKPPIVPLIISTKGVQPKFVAASGPIPISKIRHLGGCNTFRFADSAGKEVYDGPSEGEAIRMGRLQIVDTYQETMLAAHPLLPDTKPDALLLQELQRTRRPFKGAIYPQVTLIPAWFPIIVSVALCRVKGSDHKFFKSMLELKAIAESCEHDYTTLMAAEAGIMVFNQTPEDNIYDYIEMVPLLKQRAARASRARVSSCLDNNTDTDDYNPDDYESIDDAKQARLSLLKHRVEPVVLATDMAPESRLPLFKEVYDTGQLPEDDDPEEERPYIPPRPVDNTPTPPLPPRDVLPDFRHTRHVPGEKKPPTPAERSQSFATANTKTSRITVKRTISDTNITDSRDICIPVDRPNKPPPIMPKHSHVVRSGSHEAIPYSDTKIRTYPEPKPSPAPHQATVSPLHPSEDPEPRTSPIIQPANVSPMHASNKPVLSELRKRLSTMMTAIVAPVQTKRPQQYNGGRSADPATRPGHGNERLQPTCMQDIPGDVKEPTHITCVEDIPGGVKEPTHITCVEDIPGGVKEPARITCMGDIPGGVKEPTHITCVEDIPGDVKEPARITCMGDIPGAVMELSVPQLMDCLRLLNMSQHVPALERNLVDGELLLCLDETLLIDNFGFNVFDAKKLVRFAHGWRPKMS